MECQFRNCREPAAFHYWDGSETRHLCIHHMRQLIPHSEQNRSQSVHEQLESISPETFQGTVGGILGFSLEESIQFHNCCLLIEVCARYPTILISEADLSAETISKIEFMLNGDFRILPVQCGSLFELVERKGFKSSPE